MKKPFVLIAAIVAVVGLGAAVAVAKETTNAGASVTLRFKASHNNYPDEGGLFSGQVKAIRACEKERKVVLLYRIYERVDVMYDSDRTNDRGKYHIEIGPGSMSLGRFIVKATEKRITKRNGDQVVCKAAKSKPRYVVKGRVLSPR